VNDARTAVTREEIEAELKDVLVNQFFVKAEDLRQDAHLIDDLELDSLDLMAALAQFEERYSIRLENDEIMEMATFGKCVDKLAQYSRAAA
jgi:acyl carrier protein